MKRVCVCVILLDRLGVDCGRRLSQKLKPRWQTFGLCGKDRGKRVFWHAEVIFRAACFLSLLPITCYTPCGPGLFGAPILTQFHKLKSACTASQYTHSELRSSMYPWLFLFIQCCRGHCISPIAPPQGCCPLRRRACGNCMQNGRL